MRAYHLRSHARAGTLVHTEVDEPVPGPGEVRIRVEVVSLNYRDLLVLDAAATGELDGRIPLSDGAGVIDAVGPDVTRWAIGDRVAAAFFPDWIGGRFERRYMASALGGSLRDGMFAEAVILPKTAVVAVPTHLTLTEAATLPCAAVTAWHGLIARGGLRTGDTLLVQGTGGVATFGIQFAAAIGARIVTVSSSDEKLARAGALGSTILINYRNVPDWDIAVMEATGGEGVTHVLELGGPATYDRSVRSLASGGKIVQIGVLTGFGPKPDLARLQAENADIIGVTVGSVAHFEAMNGFLSAHAIRPVVDRVYDAGAVSDSITHLRSGSHVGKVTITLSS